MTERIEHIIQKVKLLAEKLDNTRRQNILLTDENKKLKAELASQQDRIGELTDRLTKTQQALAGQRGDTETESSQHLRKQIDQYISEIDRCIAWLQNA